MNKIHLINKETGEVEMTFNSVSDINTIGYYETNKNIIPPLDFVKPEKIEIVDMILGYPKLLNNTLEARKELYADYIRTTRRFIFGDNIKEVVRMLNMSVGEYQIYEHDFLNMPEDVLMDMVIRMEDLAVAYEGYSNKMRARENIRYKL